MHQLARDLSKIIHEDQPFRMCHKARYKSKDLGMEWHNPTHQGRIPVLSKVYVHVDVFCLPGEVLCEQLVRGMNAKYCPELGKYCSWEIPKGAEELQVGLSWWRWGH